MTIYEWLIYADVLLKNNGISSSRLDAEVLLAHKLQKDKSWLIAHANEILHDSDIKTLEQMLKKRQKHVPLAYILGEKEFYGRMFKVNENVLVPRPESEAIIDEYLALELPESPLVADIGSGSGALGITAALEKNSTRLVMIDIDPKTLSIAKYNARKYGIKAQYYQGDLLNAWRDDYDVLFCNLPYVPKTYAINTDATYEPAPALFGGQDGLDLFRRLFMQLREYIKKPIVISESLPFQHQTLEQIAHEHGYLCTKTNQFIQVFIQNN